MAIDPTLPRQFLIGGRGGGGVEVKRNVWPLFKNIFLYPAPGLEGPDPYC